MINKSRCRPSTSPGSLAAGWRVRCAEGAVRTAGVKGNVSGRVRVGECEWEVTSERARVQEVSHAHTRDLSTPWLRQYWGLVLPSCGRRCCCCCPLCCCRWCCPRSCHFYYPFNSSF